MTNKIDKNDKFKFGKQNNTESLVEKQKRYYDSITVEKNNKSNKSLKSILVTIDENTHHQLSIVHKYLRKKQSEYVAELIQKDLKKKFPAAWSALNKEFSDH